MGAWLGKTAAERRGGWGDDPRDLELFPVRILTPAGEVVFEEKLPGGRTVRSVLKSLRTGAPGRLTLLKGSSVIRQSAKISELNLSEEDVLCLVKRFTTTYVPFTESGEVQPHYMVKCLLLGAAEAGKTSWSQAVCREEVGDRYKATIGVDFKVRRLQSEAGLRIRVQLWDVAGELRFRPKFDVLLKGASGILAFFSLAKPDTLREVIQMLDDAVERYPTSCQHVCLVATHADVPDAALEEEAAGVARQRGWPFFAVSLKSEAGVDDPLFTWLDAIMEDNTGLHKRTGSLESLRSQLPALPV